jgi:hypothetical protein
VSKDLLQAVRAFHEGRTQDPRTEASPSPRITRFGTVTVSPEGVQIREFSTENTPHEGDLPRTVIDWAIQRLVDSRKLFGPPATGIQKYAAAVQHSLHSHNWFGALFLSLAIPDICGALENPAEGVGNRYKKWFDRYVGFRYVPELFSADDCYYLRCAALHQGLAEHPKAQNKRIVFITPPPPGMKFHSNFIQSEDGSFVLQMQIDIFCDEICQGITQWLRDVAGNQDVQKRLGELLEFQDPSQPLNW